MTGTKFDAPRRTIDHQIDTLIKSKSSAAYFSPGTNTITQNYTIEKDNSYNLSLSILAHEQKHRDNNAQGLNNMPMSLAQYYKICCHDEISATICELLQLRQEYITAKTKEDREKIMQSNQEFDYYFNAVEKGEINPFSNSSKEFEKEMKFIATQTQKMWIENHSYNYNDNHTSMTKNFFDSHNLEELKANPENYNKGLKIAYTIGGIDFSKYLEDIPNFNPTIEKADKEIANGKHRNIIRGTLDDKAFTTDKATYMSSNIQLSFEQRATLINDKTNAATLKKILNIKKQYTKAKTKEEINSIKTEDWTAQQYLNKLKKGEFKNKNFPLGEDEINFINKYISSHIFDMGVYEEAKSNYLINPDIFKKNDKNYQTERSKLFTIDGFDYSSYIYSVKPQGPYSNFIEADRLIEKKAPPRHIENLLKASDDNSLIGVNYKFNNELNPLQQYQLGRHQMFIQNALSFKMLTNLNSENTSFYEDFITDIITDYKNHLVNSPELLEQWQKQEQELAASIVADSNKLKSLNGNEELYKKELEKIYTYNDVNLQSLIKTDVGTLLPETDIPQNLIEHNNSKWYEKAFNKMINTFLSDKRPRGVLRSSCPIPENNHKRIYKPTHYTGEPVYPEWSPEKRVSEVLYSEIYDFTKPFLKTQYEQLLLNEIEQQCNVSSTFSEIKINKALENHTPKKDKEKPPHTTQNKEQKNNTQYISTIKER